jgi:uncharacterized protein (DUF58 family)
MMEKSTSAFSDLPILEKGKLEVNFPKVISEFENAMHRFPIKKVLYRAIFRGRGLEFDSYREFGPDDDAEMIDWKASLRANDLLARKYIEERNLNVYFLVDVGNSMLCSSGKKLKAEYAAELVVSLGHLIVDSGDRIGLVMFNDDVVKVLHPSSSKNQFALFTKLLADSEYYGGGFDLSKTIDTVLRTIKSSYTVFILVSDFIRTRKDIIRSFKLIGSRFETMAIMVRDPIDERLPDSSYQLSIQDPYSGRQMVLDPAIAGEKYRLSAAHQKAALREMFKKSQIDVIELDSSKSFIIPVSSFLKARAAGGGRF